MTDYSKLKNAELESLLKERSLPHTGKKAEMVARLIEFDKPKKDASSTSSSKAPPMPATATILSSSKLAEEEDLIDDGNDEEDITLDPPTASTAPAAAAVAAGGLSRIKNPTAVPNQISAIDPSKTNDLKATKPPTGAGPAKPNATKPKPSTTTTATPNPTPPLSAKQPEPEPTPAQDFSSGLAATSLATELAKRKTRAAKFGVPETTDPEVVKALERAKKFGTAAGGTALASGNGDGAKVGLSKLDEALPERRERKRGRGREDEGAGAEDEGLKRRRGGRGTGVGERRERGARSGERRGGRNGNRNGNGNEKTSTTTAGWMSEADRRQAEARKAKWAAAAPAAAA